jgi:hypothetical protein
LRERPERPRARSGSRPRGRRLSSPSSVRPSSIKNAFVAARSSTTMRTLSIRLRVTSPRDLPLHPEPSMDEPERRSSDSERRRTSAKRPTRRRPNTSVQSMWFASGERHTPHIRSDCLAALAAARSVTRRHREVGVLPLRNHLPRHFRPCRFFVKRLSRNSAFQDLTATVNCISIPIHLHFAEQ